MTYNAFFDKIGLAQEGRESFFALQEREGRKPFSKMVEISFREYEKGDAEFSEILNVFAEREKINVATLILYLYLKKSLETYMVLADKGVDEDILAATYAEFATVAAAHKEKTGIYGIPQGILRRWLRRYVNGTIFRIGRLNFDIAESDRDYEIGGYVLKKGEPCISVHIPKGGRLCEDVCEQSYADARDVFEKCFSMKPCFFVCYSWLLSPWLADVLPEDSLIVRFQKKYKIVSFDKSPGDMLTHIYPVTYAEVATKPVDEYSEDTMLRKKTKERMKQGKMIGYGTGIRL